MSLLYIQFIQHQRTRGSSSHNSQLELYLRAIFDFIGIIDIQFVNVNGLNTVLSEQSLAQAQETLHQLAINW
ncbi:hypothetical protein [Dendronalium sp. ChiSLP03b]|uniref:hypothetical protein n=1 Tax=Dendronalium sp. ChiSLP03b TaxID=3075381 RepID=UPI002AD47B51|nr:hypothetical protein [Dendronalium sp. ChiSLP03b]MDZ8208719.1 hypothetical protein [Dendronalium sp. ChiSLP03b]